MTPEQKIEGNKLIAEFMGAKVHDKWGEYLDATYYAVMPKSSFTGHYSEEEKIAKKKAEDENKWNPQYHTSWDWLMPVCIKLGMSTVSVNIKETYNEVLEKIKQVV